MQKGFRFGMMQERNLFIIGGCNGSGKTTASFTILPQMLNCREFVNADEIARGLSPFQPDRVALEAGRIMLTRIEELIRHGETFAFETTLASRSFVHIVKQAKENSYAVTLIFFWLRNEQLAKERVRQRVAEGGHAITGEVISRRFQRGIVNLFDLYLPVIDEALIFDNSAGQPLLLAEKPQGGTLTIVQQQLFGTLKLYYEQHR